jgi:hypothetical protein
MVTNFHQGESLEVGIYGGVKYTLVEQVLLYYKIWIFNTYGQWVPLKIFNTTLVLGIRSKADFFASYMADISLVWILLWRQVYIYMVLPQFPYQIVIPEQRLVLLHVITQLVCSSLIPILIPVTKHVCSVLFPYEIFVYSCIQCHQDCHITYIRQCIVLSSYIVNCNRIM